MTNLEKKVANILVSANRPMTMTEINEKISGGHYMDCTQHAVKELRDAGVVEVGWNDEGMAHYAVVEWFRKE